MKYRILLCFMPLLVAGCTLLGAGSIQFTGAGLVPEPTCWIQVLGTSAQDIFFDSPSFDDPNETGLGFIFGLTVLLADEFEDVIYIQVDTQVEEYTITNQGYWFLINMDGFRTASLTRRTLRFPDGEDEVYRFEDDIFQFSQWVNIRNVSEVDLLSIENDCLELIESDEFEALGIEREVFCEVNIDINNAQLRVGPGLGRSVRALAEINDIYDAVGFAEVDGQTWYEIDSGSNGLLWVSEQDVSLVGRNTPDDENANCSDLPNTDAPLVVVSSVQESNINASIQNCATFTVLSPIGTVPVEESTYMWSPVEDAEEYILNFSDFQGNYVTSISVDGAETSTRINTGSLATGSQLSFEIVAMVNGEIACRTNSGPLTRLAGFVAPETPTPEPEDDDEKKDKDDDKDDDDDDDDDGGYTPPEE